jgi:hypothetical protein
MLKRVQVIAYGGNYAYSPPDHTAIINISEVVSMVQIPRENTRRPFDDVTRIRFRDGSSLDVIGTPVTIMEDNAHA